MLKFSILRLSLAVFLGSSVGVLVSIFTVMAFAAMILNSIFCIYYSLIFFIIGSFYLYKVMKKN